MESEQWGVSASSAASGGGGGGGGGGGISASTLSAARLAATALAALFFVVLCVTIGVDGSPFRSALLTPWMNATLVDFYLNALVLCIWVWLREAPRLGRVPAALVIVYLLCLGSFATWSYVAHLLWVRTRPGDTLSKVVLG
jgi:hypothetical protein